MRAFQGKLSHVPMSQFGENRYLHQCSDFTISDEYTQVFDSAALGPLKLHKKDRTNSGVHLVCGDPRQLPAYQNSTFPIATAMKNILNTSSAVLLPIQYRQPPNLSAISSAFFYENAIRSPEENNTCACNFRCIVWRSERIIPAEERCSSQEAHRRVPTLHTFRSSKDEVYVEYHPTG